VRLAGPGGHSPRLSGDKQRGVTRPDGAPRLLLLSQTETETETRAGPPGRG